MIYTGFFRKTHKENKTYILEIYKYNLNTTLLKQSGLGGYTKKDLMHDYLIGEDVSEFMQVELIDVLNFPTKQACLNGSRQWKLDNKKKHGIDKFEFTVFE